MPRKPLSLNVMLINGSMDDEGTAQELGMISPISTYRQEDFSIGHDFVRVKGDTVAQIGPSSLKMGRTLGRGACSRVIKASMYGDEDNEENITQHVALKQFPLNCTRRQDMLTKELRALTEIDCECLVKLLGAYLESNTVTLVLEYMDRGTLQAILESRRGVPLPEPVSAAITFQMLWGISYLHFEGRLHRDIKPANILLHSDGSVKLSDFGICSENKMNTTFVGTTKYMALERLRAKEYSSPADIWSLGLVILHCVTGSFIFNDIESMVDLVVTIEEEWEERILSDYSFENNMQVKEVVDGCLQVKPEKRIPSRILLQSPWFQSNNIDSIESAKEIVRKFLLIDPQKKEQETRRRDERRTLF